MVHFSDLFLLENDSVDCRDIFSFKKYFLLFHSSTLLKISMGGVSSVKIFICYYVENLFVLMTMSESINFCDRIVFARLFPLLYY